MAETSQARGSDEREEALIHQINDNVLGVGSLQTWGISTPFPCNVLKYIAMLATLYIAAISICLVGIVESTKSNNNFTGL